MADDRRPSDVRLLDRLHALDVEVYRTVATTTTPALDQPLRRLTSAANYSRLSMGAAALLAITGGQRGRRGAVTGLVSIAVVSASVNLGAKLLTRRERPAREDHGVIERRHITMPESTSFPSGHSAAAFAFAEGVRHEWPMASVPLPVGRDSRLLTGPHGRALPGRRPRRLGARPRPGPSNGRSP